ncbi:peptidase domain-containing ABC transporter [Bacillus subtilis]|nr:peptidase domain-containing ABC transporter [Bacillus subtilis]MDM5300288.1 peptidase domain-containing ABC transporter [Bacillus subtilis]MDM5322341.1 peptidase domain-containing ABC transporter [Bacillus subtilis]
MRLKKKKHKSKVPFLEQMNQHECGLCCLSMLLNYYNYHINPHELRAKFGIGRDGLTLLEIKKIAERYNFKCKAIRTSADTFFNEKFPFPAIAFFERKHYVIIEKVKNEKIFIVDPARGNLKLDKEEFKNKFSEYILFLKPENGFQEKKKISNANWMKILYPYKYLLAGILLVSFILQIISIGIPIMIKNTIDTILTQNETDWIKVFSIAFFIIILIQLGVSIIKNFLLILLQNSMDFNLMDKFVYHLFKLPYSFFETRTRGDLIYRANSNIRIREFLSQNLISTIINVFLITFLFIYMSLESFILAVSLLCIGIMQVLTVMIFKNKLKYLTQTEVNSQTNTSGYMTEILGGISTIKSLGIEKSVYKKWGNLFKKQIKTTKDKEYFKLKMDTVINTLHFSSPIIVILIGVQQVINNQMTIGGLFAFQSLSMSFLSPLNSIVLMASDLMMVGTLVNRINDIYYTEAEEEGRKKQSIDHLKGDIELKNVGFKYYENGEEVLKNITLSIKAGEKIGIVGKSGSGKSTLAYLLAGLYKPTSGEIFYDGINYNDIHKSEFRQHIGVVLQDNFLFNKNIYENLIVHKPNTSIEDIEWALDCAQLTEDIKALPMGLYTKVSETGTNFSGGQKQRIALARALVGRPSILLLDEATSSLDTITERKIEEKIETLHCTRVVIAHRLSTIMNSDQIFVMEKGRIIATGKHESLLQECDYYKELYQNNLFKYNTKSFLA